MKTAIQELIEFIDDKFIVSNSPQISSIYNKAQELLEREKEELEIAFDLGRDEVTSAFIIDGEDYYNKKFTQTK